MRFCCIFILLILLFPLTDSIAAGETRVALVIGNNDYTHPALPDLNNARTDAEGVAKSLENLGFKVTLLVDATRRRMVRGIAVFEQDLEKADVGLVFYAGHGIESQGINYLIPTDARLEIEADLRAEAVDASQILDAMHYSGAPMNILILDACRDNPLPRRTRSASRGLTRQSLPQNAAGIAILYSAGEGQVAQDGPPGGHGVFTGKLLQALEQPGLKIEDVFKRTAAAVATETGYQRPFMMFNIQGDFIFNEAGPAIATPTAPIDKETVFWNSVKESRSPEDFEDYLSQFPDGTFAPLAKRRMAVLRRPPPETPDTSAADLEQEVALWKAMETIGTKEAYQSYLKAYPEGLYRDQAKQNILKIGIRKLDAELERELIREEIRQEYQAKNRLTPPELSPGTFFRDCPHCPEMVVIPPGVFRMGDLQGTGEADEKPATSIDLGTAFAMSRFEITQDRWKAIMGTTPSFNAGPNTPVEGITWHDAQAFAEKLSRDTGQTYRLPSEAEWEYAARAGSETAYSWGDTADHAQANYGKDACCGGYAEGADQWEKAAPAGSFPANAFGLQDMLGNIWEFTLDCWQDGHDGVPTDGTARPGQDCSYVVVKGGSWLEPPDKIRAAERKAFSKSGRNATIGFRVVRELGPETPTVQR
ncbi:MAG: SUMF1/EgtB/PvdO family nonheme iron enzyme [Magnetospiraceae bacterium]